MGQKFCRRKRRVWGKESYKHVELQYEINTTKEVNDIMKQNDVLSLCDDESKLKLKV